MSWRIGYIFEITYSIIVKLLILGFLNFYFKITDSQFLVKIELYLCCDGMLQTNKTFDCPALPGIFLPSTRL